MSKIKKTIEIIRKEGILRPNDLDKYGIPRRYMSRLFQRGVLERTERGLYKLKEIDLSENESLIKVSKRINGGIVCLLSALQFHNITTQIPYEIWIAIERTARKPKVPELPVRIVRFSGSALNEGIENHNIKGVAVKVYNPAKTVADCFKYRNKIGMDVALEALRECRREQKCGNDDLWFYAKICRITNIMRPYMEAIQ